MIVLVFVVLGGLGLAAFVVLRWWGLHFQSAGVLLLDEVTLAPNGTSHILVAEEEKPIDISFDEKPVDIAWDALCLELGDMTKDLVLTFPVGYQLPIPVEPHPSHPAVEHTCILSGDAMVQNFRLSCQCCNKVTAKGNKVTV